MVTKCFIKCIVLPYIPKNVAIFSTAGSDAAERMVHIANISDEYTLFLPNLWENIVTIVAVGHDAAMRMIFATSLATPSLSICHSTSITERGTTRSLSAQI